MFNEKLFCWKLCFLLGAFGNLNVATCLGLGALTQSVADVVGTLNSGLGGSLVSTVTRPLSLLKQSNSLALTPSFLDIQKIDTELLDVLKFGESDALIYFNGVDDVIQSVESQHFSNLQEKRIALVESLQLNADNEQATTKSALSILGIDNYYSSFTENCIVLQSSGLDVVYVLSMLQHVTSIQKPPLINVNPPVGQQFEVVTDNEAVFDDISVAEALAAVNAVPGFPNWGIPKIQANDVWNKFTMGGGVVIANIDTGVRGTHEAVKFQWRRDNGWFDAYGNYKDSPQDGNGHGTHTMGTIVGATQNIGVAPQSQWIACRGCNDTGACGSEQLVKCADWISGLIKIGKHPDIISCSWGSGEPLLVTDFYRDTIKAWKAANILVVFAIGNAGPVCSSGGSPGDQQATFSVGSIEEDGSLSIFSSVGPETELVDGQSHLGYSKPDVVAPGGKIYSASNTGDKEYAILSGTSMATPHGAGVMGLVLSYARMKGFKQLPPTYVENLLEVTATRTGLSLPKVLPPLPTPPFCPAPQTPSLDPTHSFPNSYFGWGLVNALHAVEKFKVDFKIQP